MRNWTIFSNHGHVLVCLAIDPETRLREVAADVGLTERAVQKIVRDLSECGMISVSKHGRRNRYHIDYKKPLRHDIEAHCTLGALLKLVTGSATTKPAEARRVEPATPEPASAASRPARHKVSKSESKGSSNSPVERQQGSLF